MKQMALAASKGFDKHTRPTRKAEFLSRMETLMPWAEFCVLYPDRAVLSEGWQRLK
jgi:hypothetical protein